jgi:CHAT domain-containing protein/TPR repeat protein
LKAIESGACGQVPVVDAAVLARALVLSTTACDAVEGGLGNYAKLLAAGSREEFFSSILPTLGDCRSPEIVYELMSMTGLDLLGEADPEARTDYGLAYFTGENEGIVDRDLAIRLLLGAPTPRALQFLESAAAAGIVPEVPAHLYADLALPADDPGTAVDFYGFYRAALDGRLPPADAARPMMRALNEALQTAFAELRGGVRLEVAMDAGNFDGLVLLAELYQRLPELRTFIENAADARLSFAIATAIIEGHTPTGEDAALALPLIEAAAGAGLAEAKLRLAVARANGLGGPADEVEAEALFAEAMDAGHLAAAGALASRHDNGRSGSHPREYYDDARTMAADWPTELGDFLRARLAAGSPFLASAEGRAWLDDAAATSPDLAMSLAETFLCVDCGTAADIGQGVRLLNVAAAGGHYLAPDRLADIYLVRPDLRAGNAIAPADETILARLTAPLREDPATADAALIAAAERLCFAPEVNDQCVAPAHALAIGRFGAEYAAAGFALLEELDAKSAGNSFLAELTDAALADALSFYGDYEGALQHLPLSLRGWYLGKAYDEDTGFFAARNGVIRRAIVSGVVSGEASDPALLTLLRRLSALGDGVADSFLQLLSTAGFKGTPDPPLRSLPDAQAAYDAQLSRGGLSRGLVTAVRTLSAVHFAGGDARSALEFELVALQTERALAEIAALTDGRLPAALTEICELSRSSRRVDGFGFPAVARALAKDAVNRLQDIRREMSSLPESLQLCFAAQVSDTYRLLADLFIEQGRPVEAEYVLTLLKDYETFRYLQRDPLHAEDAFDPMMLTEAEAGDLGAIARVEPPLAVQAARRDALLATYETRDLTTEELAELDAIDRAIREASSRLRDVIAALAAARDEDAEVLEAGFNSMRGRLRHEFGGTAVGLRYVVLPHRMHVIVTLPGLVKTHTWDTLDGAPFTEAALNALIADFRRDLEDRGSDPRPNGRKLFDTLLAPVWDDVASVRPDRLLVSLDRQLRLIPFAALVHEDRYLAQLLSITSLSGSQQPADAGEQRSTAIAALGVSQPVPGFGPLPAVPWELAGLVADDDGYGLMTGRVALDGDFTRFALRAALSPNPDNSLETVHIASHFALGRTDAESFLLMGGGERFSVADLKTGIDEQTLSFGSVDLLTLSACQTAVPLHASDGSELESFAAVVQANAGRAVLATLWPIADKSTALLMQRFYELGLVPGTTRSAALAAAMSEFIENRIGGDNPEQSVTGETARRGEILTGAATSSGDFAAFQHPYHWAAFVLLEGH